MSDLRSVLERADRAAGRIPLPSDGFDRLVRFRDRRRWNQRIASGLLALVLAAAAIGAAINAFRAAERQLPATQPITPSNVARLSLAWTAPLAKGHGMAMADGAVYVYGGPYGHQRPGRESTVAAFAASCGENGSTCGPLWTANIPSVQGGAGLAVADGVVYATADDLYAFPADCGNGGASCSPTWVGKVEPGGVRSPMAAGGEVFVGVPSPDGGRVYAFPADCGSGGATCHPLWVSRLLPQGDVRPMAIADGVLYATGRDLKGAGLRLYAFPTNCGNGGTACRPMWVWKVPSRMDPVIADGKLFVATGTGGTLSAYDASCPVEPSCKPVWTARFIGNPYVSGPVVADGEVFLAEGLGVSAYPVECSAVCKPLWSTPEESYPPGFIDSGFPARNGVLFVGSDADGVSAYATQCGNGGAICKPLWTEESLGRGRAVARGVGGLGLEEGSGYLFATQRNKVYAFAPSKPQARASASDKRSALLFYAVAAVLAGALLLLMIRRRSPRPILRK